MSETQDDERAERIAAAFALLTARLEDAAGLAGEGQAHKPDVELKLLARQIADLTNEAGVIAGALAELLLASDQDSPA